MSTAQHVCKLQKRERLGLPDGDTDPALDEFSDGEWEVQEDPPELVAARKKLDAYISNPHAGVPRVCVHFLWLLCAPSLCMLPCRQARPCSDWTLVGNVGTGLAACIPA